MISVVSAWRVDENIRKNYFEIVRPRIPVQRAHNAFGVNIVIRDAEKFLGCTRSTKRLYSVVHDSRQFN